jgi:predicted acyltransferase
LVGFSVVLALTKYKLAWVTALTKEAKLKVLQPVSYKVLSRFVKLFVIGAFINLWAGGFNFKTWVIMGVLQRIAVCYVVLALLYVFLPSRLALRATVLSILLLYCGLMYGLDVPDCGRGNLTPSCNASGYVSRQIWGSAHVPPSGTIPEGLVSTLAALVTTHAGLEYSLVMRRCKQQHPSTLLMLWCVLSAAYLTVGGVLTLAVPNNKQLWSPPFALIVSGVAGAMMSIWLFMVDLRCGVDLPAAWWLLPCSSISSMQHAVAIQHGAPPGSPSDPAAAHTTTNPTAEHSNQPSLNRTLGAGAAVVSNTGAGLSAPLLGGDYAENEAARQFTSARVNTAGASSLKIDSPIDPEQSSLVNAARERANTPHDDVFEVRVMMPTVWCGCNFWKTCCSGTTTQIAFAHACRAVDVALLRPLVWLGRNPAFIFIAMVALEVLLMDTLKLHGEPIWTLWYKGFAPGKIGPQLASSCVALVTLVLWTTVAGVMHHYKFFVTL